MPQIRIPKQSDRAQILALAAIRDELRPLRPLTIQVISNEPAGTPYDLPGEAPDKEPSIDYILSEESQIMPLLNLKEPSGQVALQIRRLPNQIVDEVTIAQEQNWINQLPQDKRSQIIVKLTSLTRKHLRAPDTEATLSGGSDLECTRYRDSQQVILNSLQETLKFILAEYTRKSLDAEAAARTRLDESERELQSRHKASEERLAQEHKVRMDELASREATIKAREESFNTKEARYVTRKEQQNQIDQLKGWLEG
jgi:hypothetical protein